MPQKDQLLIKAERLAARLDTFADKALTAQWARQNRGIPVEMAMAAAMINPYLGRPYTYSFESDLAHPDEVRRVGRISMSVKHAHSFSVVDSSLVRHDLAIIPELPVIDTLIAYFSSQCRRVRPGESIRLPFIFETLPFLPYTVVPGYQPLEAIAMEIHPQDAFRTMLEGLTRTRGQGPLVSLVNQGVEMVDRSEPMQLARLQYFVKKFYPILRDQNIP